MTRADEYIYSPASARRFGLPPVGFRVVTPAGLHLAPADPAAPTGAVLLTITERRGGWSRLYGQLEIALFSAALIMDRDGVLEDMVAAAVEHAGALIDAGPITLPCGDGFFARARSAGDAPSYATAWAIGHPDYSIPAGLFVQATTAAERWDACDTILDSLRFT